MRINENVDKTMTKKLNDGVMTDTLDVLSIAILVGTVNTRDQKLGGMIEMYEKKIRAVIT